MNNLTISIVCDEIRIFIVKYAGNTEKGEKVMIEVTRMNGEVLLINADLIEMVEETPDTIISFTNGKKIIVKESRQEIKNLVKSYRKDIFAN